MGWHGKGAVQTRSPSSPSGTGTPEGEKAAIAMPRPEHWISPEYTGRRGQGAPKREIMSVPPVMEPRFREEGKAEYTYSNVLGARGEPVE